MDQGRQSESPLNQVLVYAHWLDCDHGEAVVQRDYNELENQHIRHIKLLALLGHKLTLNDNQLIACPAVAHLFASEAFRIFLEHHPDFLEFRVPTDFVADNTPFGRVTGNLERLLGSDSGRPMVWHRPGPDTVRVVRAIARMVLKEGEIRPAEQLADLQRPLGEKVWGESGRYVSGVLHAYNYFVNDAAGIQSNRAVENLRLNWFDVVSKANEELNFKDITSKQDENLRIDLARLVEFVRDNGAESLGRNAFRDLLRKRKRPTHGSWWHTVVSAWNVAVETSLGVEGSLSPLPLECSISMATHHPVDYFSHARNQRLRSPWLRVAELLNWDPLDLSWRTIDDVRATTAHTRLAAQEEISLHRPPSLHGATDAHVREIAKAVASFGLRALEAGHWGILATMVEALTDLSISEWGEQIGTSTEWTAKRIVVTGVLRDEWRRAGSSDS